VTICRRISFSSGHRYYNESLTEEENRRVFGNAYSRSGFGHNFILEAYVEGAVDPKTGMVINLRELDALLKEVVHPLDHHFLNTEVPYFNRIIPSAENIAVYCFDAVSERLDHTRVRLKRVRLYEGPDMWVDCPGEAAI